METFSGSQVYPTAFTVGRSPVTFVITDTRSYDCLFHSHSRVPLRLCGVCLILIRVFCHFNWTLLLCLGKTD